MRNVLSRIFSLLLCATFFPVFSLFLGKKDSQGFKASVELVGSECCVRYRSESVEARLRVVFHREGLGSVEREALRGEVRAEAFLQGKLQDR